ncbi:MAG: M48 family metalloprotease [Proteobacteria bacterium]|jgi:beta-barrel assembly-enhancing protease|nr:M48 family metalloprotease [Pseudomonadota bacterium]
MRWFALLFLVFSAHGGPFKDMLKVIGGNDAQKVIDIAETAERTFEKITPEQEYYIGRTVGATIVSTYRPYRDVTANRYLNTLGQTLAMASDRPQTFGGYHFQILDTDEVHAFAAPGGLIFVSRGMIKLAGNEDTLAAVLAHEVAHVQFEHGVKAIKKSRFAEVGNLLANEATKTLNAAEQAQLAKAFGGSIDDITSTLMTAGYSKTSEYQADEGAVTILRRAGYDPHVLEDLLAALGAQEGAAKKGFFSTHPPASTRAERVSKLIETERRDVAPIRSARFQQALSFE